MGESVYPLQLTREEFREIAAKARLEHLVVFNHILEHQLTRVVEMFDIVKAELEWRLTLNGLMVGPEE